jgi:hypothetical protein
MSSCGLSTLNAGSPRESCQTDIMKADKLRKGMTYEQVLQILGCEPAESETITYGNGVVAKLYRWQAGKDQISASFRDGREPPRVCRRPFGISYAAMAGCSSMA